MVAEKYKLLLSGQSTPDLVNTVVVIVTLINLVTQLITHSQCQCKSKQLHATL